MKKFRLKKLKLDEVSLVPSGDDPMAEVVIAKSDNKTQSDVLNEHTLVENTTAEEAPVADDISKDDLPGEVVEYIEALEDKVDELSSITPEDESMLAEALEDLEAELDTESVLAKADPEIRQLIEKAEARAEAAEELAKSEREARLHREYIEKAAAFDSLPITTDRLGAILKSVDELLPEDQSAEVAELLKAANAQLAQSDLFAELGTSVAKVAPNVDGLITELRKADPSLSYEAAMTKVYESNTALYEQES